MSDEMKPESYEVGYGKPPKANQFRKGLSGNPKGRPKKGADFFAELMKEANAPITNNDNGRRISIPKAQGIAKQLTNKALTGDLPATRIFLAVYPQAREIVALAAAQQTNELERRQDVKQVSQQELEQFILASEEWEAWKSGKWDYGGSAGRMPRESVPTRGVRHIYTNVSVMIDLMA